MEKAQDQTTSTFMWKTVVDRNMSASQDGWSPSPLPSPPNFDAVGLRIKFTVTFRTTVVKEEKGTITSSEGAERNQYHRCTQQSYSHLVNRVGE